MIIDGLIKEQSRQAGALQEEDVGLGLFAVSAGVAATWGSAAPGAAGGGASEEGELPPEACLEHVALWMDQGFSSTFLPNNFLGVISCVLITVL